MSETSRAYRQSDLMSQSATPTQCEFVMEEFDTSVTEEFTTQFSQELEVIGRLLRLANDDLIKELLHDRL